MWEALFARFTLLDGVAVAWFVACWIGYDYLSERSALGRRGLIGVSHIHRLAWARQLLGREMRVSDIALVGNLMSSVSFYANTTIYIVAGLFAVFGALDKLLVVTADLPFGRGSGRDLTEIKIMLLIATFLFAYFKFTWSLRQSNLLSILIGAAPTGRAEDDPALERFAQKIARISSYGGDEFNRGIRAYYFGLAALCWLISPGLFLIVTTLIVGVLYRRDFASATLRALSD